MSLRFIKPFLFVLVLPVLRGAVQYLQRGEFSGVLLWEAVLLTVIVGTALIRCRFFSVKLGKNELIVKKGLFFCSVSRIPRRKISSLHISQDILDRIFGSATCHINTEAGRAGNPDFIFKLSHTDAARLCAAMYGGEKKVKVAYSPLKIALLAAATSSSVTGVVVGVPLIRQIGKQLDLAVEQMLLDRINTAAERVSVYIPPVFGAISLILLFAYGFAATMAFFRYLNFSLRSDSRRIEVCSGFITKKRTVFNRTGINNICIEQNPLMRLFRMCSMYASVGGYGNRKGEKAVVVPCGRRDTVKGRLYSYFPQLRPSNAEIHAKHGKRMLWRFLFVPRIIIGAILLVAVALAVFFAYFDRLIVFVSASAIILSLYYGSICYTNYKHGGISFGDTVYARGLRGFTIRELYCTKDRIGVIRLCETPADRRHKTCKVILTVRSESGDRVKAHNLDIDRVYSEIEQNFQNGEYTAQNGKN